MSVCLCVIYHENSIGYFGKDVLLFLAKAGVTRLQVKR